jgi:hypothetical protein
MMRIRKRRRKVPLGPSHGYVACDWLLRAFSCDPHKIQGRGWGAVSAETASTPTGAVFLSYASQDAEAAQKICDVLRAAEIEVWFDQSELRGGEAWDRQIRQQIHDCRLFIAVISANSEQRDEGYFRREWRLAVERAGDMAEKKAFLVPVVIDGTNERGASVPDKFREVHWSHAPGGHAPPAFIERVRHLLSPEPSRGPTVRARKFSRRQDTRESQLWPN